MGSEDAGRWSPRSPTKPPLTWSSARVFSPIYRRFCLTEMALSVAVSEECRSVQVADLRFLDEVGGTANPSAKIARIRHQR